MIVTWARRHSWLGTESAGSSFLIPDTYCTLCPCPTKDREKEPKPMLTEPHAITFRTGGEIRPFPGMRIKYIESCISENEWENSADQNKPLKTVNQIQSSFSRDQIDAAILGTFLQGYKTIGMSGWELVSHPTKSLDRITVFNFHHFHYLCLGWTITILIISVWDEGGGQY